MTATLQKLPLYYHTLRYLKPVQLYGRVFHFARTTPDLSPPPLRAPTGRWTAEPWPRRPSRLGPMRFQFLNQERDVQTWDDPELPLLWVFNLNYFESPEPDLVQDFIARASIGQGRGWHPYPVSLRIPNWIKWILRGEGVLSPEVLSSLATQTRFLSRRIERHLLANHLLANAKALIFAGCMFAGREAEAWLSAGAELLNTQLREQVLDDGAHFERSPMYHSIVTADLLDLLNLASVYPRELHPWAAAWRETAARMCGWLKLMVHPDGEIALFNDAALGIAAAPAQLFEYARLLNIVPQIHARAAGGYIRLETRDTAVIFDAAPIGPDYQPGHAHADTLSFELSHRGKRQLVNSGTSTYERGAEREYERSTAAHNTIVIDGQDQSEVWDVFRVGRRARPLGVETDHATFAEAAHDGYTRLSRPVLHRRRLVLSDRELLIHDDLQGQGHHQVTLYLHLYPQSTLKIQLDPKLRTKRIETTYRPGFNTQTPNQTICGAWEGHCPVSFTSRVLLD